MIINQSYCRYYVHQSHVSVFRLIRPERILLSKVFFFIQRSTNHMSLDSTLSKHKRPIGLNAEIRLLQFLSLKQVSEVKLLCLKFQNSKLSATNCIEKKTEQSIFFINLISATEKLYTRQSKQLRLSKKAKINKNYHIFLLVTSNLVKPMELQSRHIKLLQSKKIILRDT